MTSWLFRGARLLDPASGLDEVGDVLVRDERIRAVGVLPKDEVGGVPVVDASGYWLMPGLVDGRARVASGGAELGELALSETAAACAGGVTTLLVPPTTEAPLLDPNAVRHLVKEARSLRKLRILAVCSMLDTSGEGLSEMGALSREGCVAAGNYHYISDSNLLAKAITYAGGMGLRLSVSARDGSLGRGCAHASDLSKSLGLAGIPASAETTDVSRWLLLAEEAGVSIHFSGISCERSIQLIREAKNRGQDVSADTPVHNLIHTHCVLSSYDSGYHLMPPLREDKDLNALLAAVREGVLSICSNHRPLPATDKDQPFAESEPGAAVLETMLPLAYQHLVCSQELTPLQLVGALTWTPATAFGLESGRLNPGDYADLCLFNPEGSTDVQDLMTAGENCLEKEALRGSILGTWHRGTRTWPLED